MKKYLFLSLFLFLTVQIFAQSQGISYQAIIIDKDAGEIPGEDISGNFLPQKNIAVRFTIYDQNNNIDYQEEQQTTTDKFGMINVVIGQGTPTDKGKALTFEDIDWNGTPKSLEVDISIPDKSTEYTKLSKANLLFVPYAFHRNITATGTMIIDGATTLKSSLDVTNNSPTNLSGDLTVEGATSLNGGLDIVGTTNIDGTLNVINNHATNLSGDLTTDGTTNLNGTLNVNNNSPTNLSGNLTANGTTNINGALNVNNNSPTNLNGTLSVVGKSLFQKQLQIHADVNGSKNNKNSYPLEIEGSNQGVAITIDGSRNNSTNFITFWDKDGAQGNIQGQTKKELHNSFDYIWYQSYQALMTAYGTAIVAADVTDLDPAAAVVDGAQLVTAIADWAKQTKNLDDNVGISFNSGGADYAEYLEKLNPNEQFSFGDIVGVKGGKISKKMLNPDNYMVISKNPIVLGNMPKNNQTTDFEKVAFMGQVFVKVIGKVSVGDYIIASNRNDGIGKAINPKIIKPQEYKKIVGVAWSEAKNPGLSMINVAIGINTNYTANTIQKYQKQLDEVKTKTNAIIVYLETKDPNFKIDGFTSDSIKNGINKSNPNKLSLEDKKNNTIKMLNENKNVMENAQANARKILEAKGIDYQKYEQTKKLMTDPNYAISILEDAKL